MRRLAINDVELIGGDSRPAYFISGLEGFEDPDRRVGSYVRSGEDGGNVGSNLYGLRPITITGGITGHGSVDLYLTARRALVSACRLRSDAYGIPELARIEVTDDGGVDYYLDVVITSFKAPPSTDSTSMFIIQAVAPDPVVYRQDSVSTGIINRPVSGGAVYPLIYPVIYSPSSGGVGNIYNDGETETWPLIMLRGIMLNPFIYSVESDRYISLSYETTDVADEIVIDMRQKTIMLNGFTSLLGAKSDDSDWFSLGIGTNTIRFSTGRTSDDGTMEVTANPAMLGVV